MTTNDEILALDARRRKAMVAGDTAELETLLHRDLTYTHSSGAVDTKSSYIGGVREKVLAAQRAGLKRVILPSENEHDLDELPAETRKEMEFTLADSIDDVLAVAFSSNGAGAATAATPAAPPA